MLGNCGGRALCLAGETAADVGALRVDAAHVPLQEFATVFDDEFVGAEQGEMEAARTQRRELSVFVPTEFDAGKGVAAKGRTIPATGGVVQRVVQQ